MTSDLTDFARMIFSWNGSLNANAARLTSDSSVMGHWSSAIFSLAS
jgi:hypothetical protein